MKRTDVMKNAVDRESAVVDVDRTFYQVIKMAYFMPNKMFN